jgi:hypothetical protein
MKLFIADGRYEWTSKHDATAAAGWNEWTAEHDGLWRKIINEMYIERIFISIQ